MKKLICLAVVVLMIGLVGCAGKKMSITQKDLPTLKGTWEGVINYGLFGGVQSGPMTLEILNDTVPVKGRVTLDIPQNVGSYYGVPSGKSSRENNEGKLTPGGTILWTGGGAAAHSMEATLTDAGKLQIFYYLLGMRGDATLTKK
jgi:hypothetical protein